MEDCLSAYSDFLSSLDVLFRGVAPLDDPKLRKAIVDDYLKVDGQISQINLNHAKKEAFVCLFQLLDCYGKMNHKASVATSSVLRTISFWLKEYVIPGKEIPNEVYEKEAAYLKGLYQ